MRKVGSRVTDLEVPFRCAAVAPYQDDGSAGRPRPARLSQNGIVRFALNCRWLEEQGVPDMNAPAAIAALKNAKPPRMDELRSQSRLDRSSLRG